MHVYIYVYTDIKIPECMKLTLVWVISHRTVNEHWNCMHVFKIKFNDVFACQRATAATICLLYVYMC